jgi:hypothetical protein
MKRVNQTVFYIERMQPDWLGDQRWSKYYERLGVLLPGVLIGALVSFIVNIFLPTIFVHAATYPGLVIHGLLGGLLGGLLCRSENQPQLLERKLEPPTSKRSSLTSTKLLKKLLIGLGCGLSIGLLVNIGLFSRAFELGLLYGGIFALSSLLLSVVVVTGEVTDSRRKIRTRWWANLWGGIASTMHLRNALLAGILLGGSFGLGYALGNASGFGLSSWLSAMLQFGPNGLNAVLNYGLVSFLVSIILVGRKRTIELVEIIHWSPRGFLQSLVNIRHLRNTLLVGLGVGLSLGLAILLVETVNFGLVEALQLMRDESRLTLGFSAALSYWLLVGLFHGFSSDTLDEQARITPNQGIRRSAQNGLLIGIVSGCISGFVFILSSVLLITLENVDIGLGVNIVLSVRELLVPTNTWISETWIIVLAGGLLAGLLNGGVTCLRHNVLRWLLSHAGFLAWNYARFLDYAAEHILLRKVGGGYIFVHRLLLEYFASLEVDTAPSDMTRTYKEQGQRIS